MLQWNALHPYSAIHVVQLPGTLDATRLRACINATLETRGLAHLTLDLEERTFQYQAGPADCAIQIIAGGDDPRPALAAEMERQLNQPFACTERFNPFRFLVAPAGESFFLGVVYFHPAADAESVVFLLRDIANRYLAEGTPGFSDTLDLYPHSHAHLLGRHPGVVLQRLLALPRQVRNLRQSCRAPFRDAADMTNGFRFFSVAPDDLRSLIAATKSWEVTLNDLFMALLLKVLSPLAAARKQAGKRRKLSLGCIVNLRKELGVDSRQTFGLFLGSFTVAHDVPEGISLRALAGDIRQQTLAIKRRQLYLGTPLELGFARFMLKFFSPERRKKFYPKNYPLWGGITNMNLNALWEPREGGAPLDYFRGVSTGPVTPLVLSVTTVCDRANIGLSYRTTVYAANEVEGISSRFLDDLSRLNKLT